MAAQLPVPANLIPLDTPQGEQIFSQSQKSDYFWRLNLQFVSQDNLGYCSIASSVMVLNALNVTAPSDPNFGPYKTFTQNNFFTAAVEKVLPSELVKKQGATIEQISKALATFGVKVQHFYANEITINDFRMLAVNTINNKDGYIIVNFLRPALGEQAGGHFSPLAAYDKKTDRFLILDVARYRYPPVWVKTEDLWKAMNTFDSDAHVYRGFIIVQNFPLVSGLHSMVVTNNPFASEVAQEILSSGGNAVDASIAAGFVLGLTEPESSGVGGGGYALTYIAKNKQKIAYDGREVAPHTANPEWFLDKDGKPINFIQAVLSPKSVGVPSAVALLYKLHQDQGKLSWNRLLAPAIHLAQKGFPLSPRLHDALCDNEAILEKNIEAKKVYFDGDKIKPVGSLIQNFDYANTLTEIAKNPNTLYSGKLAHEIISVINHKAGSELFNAHDFSNYKVKLYQPICSNFRSQYEICTIPPSSGGGVALLELMGIYELKYSGHDYNDPKWIYYFFEASKLAYADRNQYLADPAFVKQPVAGLLSPEYWQERSKLITNTPLTTPVQAGSPKYSNSQFAPDTSNKIPGTTSISIVDKDGNAISITLTVEGTFGSHIFTHGFFLNNELTDFSLPPKDKDGKLIANRVEAGKRPRSSIAPTLVFNNNHALYIVTGAPGGNPIICYVAKSLILMLDMHMNPKEANAFPNLCAMNVPPIIEETSTPIPQINALEKMGEKITRKKMVSGSTNIIRNPNGGWLGAADPRKEGLAIGR